MTRRKISKPQKKQVVRSTGRQSVTDYQKLLIKQLYGSGLHHNYPEIFPSIRHKDRFPYKTHITSPYFERTLKTDANGNFAIYYCPMVTPFMILQQQGNTLDNSFSPGCYHYYADNNNLVAQSNTAGSSPYYTPGQYFHSTASGWQYVKQDVAPTDKFSKCRLLSAYLTLKYIGKYDDMSGLIKVAMGFKNFSGEILDNPLSIDDLDNQPAYRVFGPEHEIIIKHKNSDDDFLGFGPYSPYKSIPYFIIWGEGLPPNQAFFITAKRTIEGVVKPIHEEFSNPVVAPQFQLNPMQSQNETQSQPIQTTQESQDQAQSTMSKVYDKGKQMLSQVADHVVNQAMDQVGDALNSHLQGKKNSTQSITTGEQVIQVNQQVTIKLKQPYRTQINKK